MPSVAVIDYGMGNLHSIAKALQHVDSRSQVLVSSDPEIIRGADRVVFPGVGAIRDCINALHDSGLAEVIKEVAAAKPMLGICLGMQALLTDSEENGGVACLGLLPGHVRRFADDLRDGDGEVLKIPHMGWNQVEQKPHPLWKNIPDRSRFYFVHSYYVVPDDARHTAATADYPQTFTCALANGNLFAVQFHPEKSQTVGLQLLQNFLAWDGTA
ncbi:imidazole glycerol phosphate synthase subunit HisH [Methylomonas sp. EFPC3]|uniref:imidazole glycerol phosphate synthase subunit HisH n=1 Tax=Methylomonas sp. EFPC3 TaxID=3021710 RepID=UPI002416FADF|nr:imidazole glycerol phosphate synthase subunit HisH [Methylomonas sp. EFPC3]WFP49453.1 imidazole glycerol phosphate synthase subunit HisH [Methylomonas sp. EFPC3]